MHLEGHPGLNTGTLDKLLQASDREWRTAL
jgi:hypothetical protein